MNPFNRLPGTLRAPAGLEWWLFRKLPAILLAGLLLLGALFVLLQSGWIGMDARPASTASFALFGLMLTHVMGVLAAAIGCVVVMIMKGPGYVRDPYPLPDAAQDDDGPGGIRPS